MTLIKATGNGMSHQIASLDERKRAMQRKDAGEAYRKHATYFQPKAPSLSELENLLLGNKEREPDAPEVSAAIREFQQLEGETSRPTKGPSTPVQTIGGPTPEVFEENLMNIQKKRLKEQAIAKYSYQVHLKRYGFTDQQSSFYRIA